MKIAIIPARGGSKRIPRKNVRSFAGKPIISYSIEAARSSGLFDRIIVSTDDEEIARLAKSLGAEIPFTRPSHLSDDRCGTIEVINHALHWFAEHETEVEFACCIYPTAPLLQTEYLAEGFKRLARSDKQFAFSVTTFPYPVQRALALDDAGGIDMLNPEHIRTRSQDLRDAFHDAGQFYWGRTQAFLEEIQLFSSASIPIFIPRHLVHDIDTIEDWHCAELMYHALASRR